MSINVASSSSVSPPIRSPWHMNWRKTVLCGICGDLLPPNRDRSRWTIFEHPLLHELCLSQPRSAQKPVPPALRPSLRVQRSPTTWTSALPLHRHVVVALRTAVFGHTPVPRHVLEGVAGRTGFVVPAGSIENRFVCDCNRIKVVSEWQVGYGGRRKDFSSIMAKTVRKEVL